MRQTRFSKQRFRRGILALVAFCSSAFSPHLRAGVKDIERDLNTTARDVGQTARDIGSTVKDLGANAAGRAHRWFMTSANSQYVLVVERTQDNHVTFKQCMRSDSSQCISIGRPEGYADYELEDRLWNLQLMYTAKLLAYAGAVGTAMAVGYRGLAGRNASRATDPQIITAYREMLGTGGAAAGALTGGFVIATAENFLPEYRHQASTLRRAWKNSDPRVGNFPRLIADLNRALAGIDDDEQAMNTSRDTHQKHR